MRPAGSGRCRVRSMRIESRSSTWFSALAADAITPVPSSACSSTTRSNFPCAPSSSRRGREHDHQRDARLGQPGVIGEAGHWRCERDASLHEATSRRGGRAPRPGRAARRHARDRLPTRTRVQDDPVRPLTIRSTASRMEAGASVQMISTRRRRPRKREPLGGSRTAGTAASRAAARKNAPPVSQNSVACTGSSVDPFVKSVDGSGSGTA